MSIEPERQFETAIEPLRSGWAYKLPPYKGQQIVTTLESLLKPPEKSATPAK